MCALRPATWSHPLHTNRALVTNQLAGQRSVASLDRGNAPRRPHCPAWLLKATPTLPRLKTKVDNSRPASDRVSLIRTAPITRKKARLTHRIEGLPVGRTPHLQHRRGIRETGVSLPLRACKGTELRSLISHLLRIPPLSPDIETEAMPSLNPNPNPNPNLTPTGSSYALSVLPNRSSQQRSSKILKNYSKKLKLNEGKRCWKTYLWVARSPKPIAETSSEANHLLALSVECSIGHTTSTSPTTPRMLRARATRAERSPHRFTCSASLLTSDASERLHRASRPSPPPANVRTVTRAGPWRLPARVLSPGPVPGLSCHRAVLPPLSVWSLPSPGSCRFIFFPLVGRVRIPW